MQDIIHPGDEEYIENGDVEAEDDDTIDGSDANVPLITELALNKHETLHYRIIDRYYRELNKENIETLIAIVDKKSTISLRLIDWFVTKYSHKFNVRLRTNNGNYFNVHISYKAQLQSFKKKYFDPFRRRKRLKFRYFFNKDKSLSLCTTIGQLNFFKWAFSNDIVNYVINNYDVIAKAMTQSNKIDKGKKLSEDNVASVDNNSGGGSGGGIVKKGVKKPAKPAKKVGIAKPTHVPMNINFN